MIGLKFKMNNKYRRHNMQLQNLYNHGKQNISWQLKYKKLFKNQLAKIFTKIYNTA